MINYQTFSLFVLRCIDKMLEVCYCGAMGYKRKMRERNERLLSFANAHPVYTHSAIGKIFHISRSRVTRILQKGNREKRDDQEEEANESGRNTSSMLAQ